MDAKRFFMNGDEWGLYDVVPVENAEHCRRVAEEYRAHHKDTDFALIGWTTPPYVIPEPQVAISIRKMRVADLEPIIGNVMPKAAGVDSCVDYTGTPYPCPKCFAFALSVENYWQSEGFYGRQEDEIIESLHVTQVLTAPPAKFAAIVDAIVQLGRRFDLILLANADHIVDLREVDDVAAFIHGESDPTDP